PLQLVERRIGTNKFWSYADSHASMPESCAANEPCDSAALLCDANKRICLIADAGSRDLSQARSCSHQRRGEDQDLTGRIESLYIESWIGFGDAGLLGPGQRLGE